MKISTLLTLFPLLMPESVLAGTVLYTDSHHPRLTSMPLYPLFILTVLNSCRRRRLESCRRTLMTQNARLKPCCNHRNGRLMNRSWPRSTVLWCVPGNRHYKSAGRRI